MRTPVALLLVALGLSICSTVSARAESNWGLRAGFAVDGKDKSATQVEAFGVYQLPWSLRNKAGWGVSTNAELTGGILRSQGEYGFIGSLGPSLRLGNPDFPAELDLGISFAMLSRDKFGNRDYNGISQFISHAALTYHINHHLGLSYRFQHMSNAGFNGRTNPGLNMHLFGIHWFFTD